MGQDDLVEPQFLCSRCGDPSKLIAATVGEDGRLYRAYECPNCKYQDWERLDRKAPISKSAPLFLPNRVAMSWKRHWRAYWHGEVLRNQIGEVREFASEAAAWECLARCDMAGDKLTN